MNKEENGMKHAEYNKQTNDFSKVFKNDQKKPLRYSQDSFVRELINKKIRISLTTQDVFDGTLKQLGMYDILLEIKISEKINVEGMEITREATKERIFIKSNIVWVEVV